MNSNKTFIDQLQRKIEVPYPPQRIISLVPSQTELLYDLGLEKEVVGITKFCIHPNKWYKLKTRVGGTKKVNFEKIKALKPDIIIANKEENTKEEIEALAKLYPVWISDIYTLDDALEMTRNIGDITNSEAKAKELITQISQGFENLKVSIKGKPKKVVYLIWHNPIITAAKNTFIDQMLYQNNLDNLMKHIDRYPELSEDELVSLNPEILMLSSEPFPFKENHIKYYQKLLPNSKVVLVDGEMFSWYGSRLVKSPNYFINLAQTL